MSDNQEIAKAIFGIEPPPPLTPEEIEDDKRTHQIDWHRNHELICYHFAAYLEKNFHAPSNVWLAKATGLNRATVKKHLDEFDESRRKKRYRVMIDKVIGKLAEKAIAGNDTRDKELFLKYVGKFTDKHEITGRIDFRTLKEKLDESDSNTAGNGSGTEANATEQSGKDYISILVAHLRNTPVPEKS